jgi:hypothetical protein
MIGGPPMMPNSIFAQPMAPPPGWANHVPPPRFAPAAAPAWQPVAQPRFQMPPPAALAISSGGLPPPKVRAVSAESPARLILPTPEELGIRTVAVQK